MTSFSLADKFILITGASSGIGRQCAIRCGDAGAKLLLLGRKAEELAKTKAACKDPERVILRSVDINDYAELEDAVAYGKATFGRYDGIVHCAGISTTLPLRMVKPETLEHYLAVNVVGAIELTRLAGKKINFSPEGGSVIFLSSIMGQVGEKGKAIYSITKGALESGSRSLALELAARKIRVNCIAPGVVESPMSKQAVYSQNEATRKRIEALHPLGLGEVDDIAHTAVFLLSPAARWITGTTMTVDGGYTAQ